MRFLSLFAGIGGFDLGFARAGMVCVGQVEIDKRARSTLERHWPSVPRYDDVRAVGRNNLPQQIDVLCGGFPCQDLSIAGKRLGFGGLRSSLFFEMVKIADECRPAYLVWENVPGLLSSNAGWDFAAVLAALGDIGYYGAWTVLDARYFGVPQRRRRVFGVFSRLDSGAAACAEILALAERGRRHPAPRRKTQEEVAGTLGSGTARGGRRSTDLDGHGAWIVEQAMSSKWAKGVSGPAGDEHHNLIAFDLLAQGSSLSGSIVRPPNLAMIRAKTSDAICSDMAVRRLTPLECERLQGFPDGWTDHLADTARYVLLGNAVVPAVVQWIGQRMAAVVAGGGEP